jgi:hypothetical protein
MIDLEKDYPTSVDELADHLGQPHLQELIQRFLHSQLNPDVNDIDDIPLSSFPPFDSDISVYHSATSTFYSPSDLSGIRGMRWETIRSTPQWRKKEARRDCVFVERNVEIGGMGGLDVVRVLAFFSFICDGTVYPCALVQWFRHVGEESDDLTGMWMVEVDRSTNGLPVISIIHTDCILRGAHLIPVFGKDFVPKELHFSDTLDAFAAFYVNRFIDHHAFEIIF